MRRRACRLDDDGAASAGGAGLDVPRAHAGEGDHLVDAPSLPQQSANLKTGCVGALGDGSDHQGREDEEQGASSSANRTTTFPDSRHVHFLPA